MAKGGKVGKDSRRVLEIGLVREEGNVDNVDDVVTAMASPWFLVWAKTYW
jgi:hypothetical protein